MITEPAMHAAGVSGVEVGDDVGVGVCVAVLVDVGVKVGFGVDEGVGVDVEIGGETTQPLSNVTLIGYKFGCAV